MKHEEGEEMCCTQCMTELIRSCTLDRAGIMFVTDLIKDMLTSLILRRNARNGRNHYINYINIFGNWKNATMQQR